MEFNKYILLISINEIMNILENVLSCIISSLVFRQVIIVLTQLEGSGGFSIAHRLTHRVSYSGGLHDWGPPGTNHVPPIDRKVFGLHAPRPL